MQAREFVSVCTCNLANRPNAAPKLVLKADENFVWLIDYTIGNTWENLKVNPVVSLSFMDQDTLNGYQVNGSVEIVEKGAEYNTILKELEQREIDLSTRRIIEGVVRGKSHKTFEVSIPKKFVIFKIKITEVVEIHPTGGLKRENA